MMIVAGLTGRREKAVSPIQGADLTYNLLTFGLLLWLGVRAIVLSIQRRRLISATQLAPKWRGVTVFEWLLLGCFIFWVFTRLA